MSGFGRRLIWILSGLAALAAPPAVAQENLDSGKSAAQLFASDCAICHKSPQGLAKTGGVLGLEGFLREHYTASRESAAAIAGYLRAAGPAPAPARERAKKRTSKGDDTAKDATKKSEPGKSGDKKSGDKKPKETKSGDRKPAEAKPSEAKPSEAKPSEAKPTDVKSSEPKASETKPAESKPSELKQSEPKPAQSPKSD